MQISLYILADSGSDDRRYPCKYGSGCKLTDADHRAKYSHKKSDD
jgi:hypothetical protein